MSYLYSITATLNRQEIDKRGQEWTRTTQVPTFNLSSEVLGIVGPEHAKKIAADLLNPWRDPSVTVHCDVMRVHVNYWPSTQYCTDCAKGKCGEVGHTPKVEEVNDGTQWVQTSCEKCGLDIEGQPAEANWRDRGNNAHCPDGNVHRPHIGEDGQ